jgi:hypothetical protein
MPTSMLFYALIIKCSGSKITTPPKKALLMRLILLAFTHYLTASRLRSEDVVGLKKISSPASLASKVAFTVSLYNITDLSTKVDVIVKDSQFGGERILSDITSKGTRILCNSPFFINDDIVAAICENNNQIKQVFTYDLSKKIAYWEQLTNFPVAVETCSFNREISTLGFTAWV